MGAERIKLAVVGLGKMGQFHLQKFRALDGVEVVGGYDADENRQAELQSSLGIKIYKSVEELFFESDAVVIASPTPTHFALARLAAETGLHALVEKPICESPDQAEELARLFRDKQLVLQVGFLERFRFRKLMETTALEKPTFVRARRWSGSLGRDKTSDVVTDLMVHDLDILLWLMGAEPSSIAATGVSFKTNQCDIAEAFLMFPGERVAHLSASRVSAKNERIWEVYTAKDAFVIDFQTNQVTVLSAVESVERREQAAIPFDALLAQSQDFIGAIRMRRAPFVTGDEGRSGLRWSLAIREKIEKKLAWADLGSEENLASQHRSFVS